ncbi:hypothetical protein STEG23_018312 [Scotinomys teguina]
MGPVTVSSKAYSTVISGQLSGEQVFPLENPPAEQLASSSQVELERNPDDRENANDLDSNVTEFDNTNDEPDINDACRSSDLPTENEANTNGYLGELSDSNVIEFDNTNNKLDFPAACDNNNHIENEKGADIGPSFRVCECFTGD